jgi:hypothetical protein
MSKLTLSPLIKERENKRWDWTPTPVIPEEQAIVCSYVKCGRIFSQPIELTVRAEGSLETYYACPHCFSRVEAPSNLKKSLSEVSHVDLKKSSKGIKNDDAANCAYFLGYLKTRPKDASIPDECLTCNKILKCM